MSIGGLHHVTAIAGRPARNLAFYRDVLGLRLVKRTVNFDDPGTWHLYFGDEDGSPGSILTFFPHPHAMPGQHGRGQAGETAFAVPAGALDFWARRLTDLGVAVERLEPRFGESALRFEDPDGLALEIVGDAGVGALPAWTAGPVPADHAIRGIRGVTLWLAGGAATAAVLKTLGYVEAGTEGDRTRFLAPGKVLGGVVDIVDVGAAPRGSLGAGTVHHIAFRASDDAAQAQAAKALTDAGFGVTEQKERNYFRSVYFREPGGIIFEIATDDPGFAADEPREALGTTLKLPEWLEPARARIEAALPALEG